MRDFAIVFLHLIVTLARLERPGSVPLSPSPCWSGTNCSSSIAGGGVRPTCGHGSDHRRPVYPVHAPGTCPSFCHRCEAFHSAASPQCAAPTKVPNVVFAQAPPSAWPEGTQQRPHRGCRGNETA